LTIAKPEPPAKVFRGIDLTTDDAGRLAAVALRFAGEGNYRDAVQLQHWAVAAGEAGRYNLACFHAMAGNRDAAFYWLQEAALEDGVDAQWAGRDSDLETLRSDPRWRLIAPYLKACNDYWAVSGHRRTSLVLPAGYQPGTPIGVLIGMHGMGADPDGFVDDGLQHFADRLNMAIVGVSGTIPRGRRSFVWSEDPDRDAAQIRRALEDLSGRLKAAPGQLVTFGFSQGAEMAFEVAVRFPDEFRGAIVMSPGTTRPVDLSRLTTGPGNQRQGFVCTCGASERLGNVTRTQEDAGFARRAGSRVELKLYDGVTTHTFPPDFADKFEGWVKFILNEGGA
jgi:predicted esterase